MTDWRLPDVIYAGRPVVRKVFYPALVTGDIIIGYPGRQERPYPIDSHGWATHDGLSWVYFDSTDDPQPVALTTGLSPISIDRENFVEAIYHLAPMHYDALDEEDPR